MKLRKLEADNFLRLGQISVDLGEHPVHLFCGLNEAGKTSLCDAIRFALTEGTSRTTKKSENKHLVKSGAKTGMVYLAFDDRAITRDVKTGKLDEDQSYTPDPEMAIALDGYHFVDMDEKVRREFLYELLEVKEDRALIKKKLLHRGCPEHYVNQLLPLLRSGIDGAQAAAKRFASEARGAWKGLTGETYGSQKAFVWLPEIHDIDATMIPVLAAKLEKANDELLKIDEKLKRLRRKQGQLCPSCGTLVRDDAGKLKVVTRPVKDLDKLHDQIDQLCTEDGRWKTTWYDTKEQLDTLTALNDENNKASAVKKQADAYHRDVQQWVKIADALLPDGIPGEILSDRLQPLNGRLMDTALLTGWPLVQLMPDLSIQVEGRPYKLQSKSAKWRTQAMLAEAITHLAGTRLLLLDEIDILDANHRQYLLNWVEGLVSDYDTIILVGTLKQPPELEAPFKVHWMDLGNIDE